MRIEYEFSCYSQPHINLDNAKSGIFEISILGANNESQQLVVGYDETDENNRPGMTVKFDVFAGIANGTVSLPRFNEIKKIVWTFQSLLSKQVQFSINLDYYVVRCEGDEIRLGPSGHHEAPKMVDQNFIMLCAEFAPILIEHEISLTFWKMGMAAFDSGAKHEAFYYFFFFIERNFGRNETKKDRFIRYTLTSERLNKAIDAARITFKGKVESLITKRQEDVFLNGNNNAVIGELFDLRGKLLHAQPKSDWHPNDDDWIRFETAFLGTICDECVKQLILQAQVERNAVANAF